MDIKQLVTGDPKTGFYPITQDTITVIELNKAVMNLINESSSEDIIAAFDNLGSFQALITEVRNPQNICSGILVNETPEDKRVGKYEASIIANTDAETLHVIWIEIDKVVALSITNTDGTMSCIRNETELSGNRILEIEGDRSKFLSNDGTYKEINSSSVVIPVDLKLNEILSPSGSGYDFSQIYNAYISGKTVYLKDSLDKLYLVINASNDSVVYYTINTNEGYSGKPTLYWFTNVHYGGAVGTMYEIHIINDPDNILFKDNISLYIPTDDYNPATKKYVDESQIYTKLGEYSCNVNNINFTVYNYGFSKNGHSENTSSNECKFDRYAIYDGIFLVTTIVNLTIQAIPQPGSYDTHIFKYKGDLYEIDFTTIEGTSISIKLIQRVLTESEYAALGTSVNTDNILYFVTPDA